VKCKTVITVSTTNLYGKNRKTHLTNWKKSYITVQAMPTNCSALQEKAVKERRKKRVQKKSSQTGNNCYNWFHNIHRLNCCGFWAEKNR